MVTVTAEVIVAALQTMTVVVAVAAQVELVVQVEILSVEMAAVEPLHLMV
jgi:hypothetical protein